MPAKEKPRQLKLTGLTQAKHFAHEMTQAELQPNSRE